jgi:hypothetical protein
MLQIGDDEREKYREVLEKVPREPGLAGWPAAALLWHCVGPGDVPFEAKRFRHVAVPSNAKTVEPANLCPDTIDEARAAAESGLNRVGSSYDLCFAFLAHTGLSL